MEMDDTENPVTHPSFETSSFDASPALSSSSRDFRLQHWNHRDFVGVSKLGGRRGLDNVPHACNRLGRSRVDDERCDRVVLLW